MFRLRRHLAAAIIPKKLRGRSWTSYLLSKEEGERNLSDTLIKELSIKCLISVIPLRHQSAKNRFSIYPYKRSPIFLCNFGKQLSRDQLKARHQEP